MKIFQPSFNFGGKYWRLFNKIRGDEVTVWKWSSESLLGNHFVL